MKSTRERIKAIIDNVLLEEREDLKDPIAHKNTEDVEHSAHLAMGGGNAGETPDENLIVHIDHAKAAGSEPTTKNIEVVSHPDGKVVSYVDREALKESIRKSVRKSLIRYTNK